jgi:hypothetical protein
MKLSNEQLVDNLKLLGLINLSTNKPISYSGFKNRASVHKYGNSYKIVFVGQPKQNLFGFYVMYGNDSQVMKEAYDMFISLVTAIGHERHIYGRSFQGRQTSRQGILSIGSLF